MTKETKTKNWKLLITRSGLKELGINLSNSTLLRMEQAGKFPRRIRLSAASICWDRDEILQWIEDRKTERENWHYAEAS